MKTLVDIDEKLLNEALKITSAHTKKEVVNLSLKELIRHARIKRLKSKIGAGRLTLTLKELEKLRDAG